MRGAILAFALVVGYFAGAAFGKDPDLSHLVYEGRLDTSKLQERAQNAKDLRRLVAKIKAGTDSPSEDKQAILLIVKVLGLD